MTEPRVEIEHLWEGYRKRRRRTRGRRGEFRWALRDVSLAAHAGEMLGVIGSNGSGKTTLLQAIAGVLEPNRGRVATRGRIASLVDLTAGISRDLTGHENVLIGGVLLGLSRAEVRDRYPEIVEFAELTEEMLESPIFTYSAGMALRLGFSLVVHTRPDVLLVDEVLAVGDEAFQKKCVAKVAQMKEAGCCVVLVSHDLAMVAGRSNRAVLLDGGHLRFTGLPQEAVERYLELTGGAPEIRWHTGIGRT